MNWSGTSRIPDGDRVDPLPDNLRAELYAHDPRRTDLDGGGTWIAWVGVAICVLIPMVAWVWTLIDS